MAFDLAAAVLPVREAARAELRREWTRLAGPGTWFTGAERVAIAAEARAARADGEAGSGLAGPVVEAAQAVATDARHVRRDWVDDLAARGLAVEPYVEIVGIVARLSAVDTYVAGVGAAEEPLPGPATGEPSRERNGAAEYRDAFVPTVGADQAPFMLTAVPAEATAQMELHGPLYLTIEQMGDLELADRLTRAEMELVAARVSYRNDCFY